MITLYYTADYELFMGCNHLSPQQVLLEPTADLLEQCEQWQIPLTLFADGCPTDERITSGHACFTGFPILLPGN